MTRVQATYIIITNDKSACKLHAQNQTFNFMTSLEVAARATRKLQHTCPPFQMWPHLSTNLYPPGQPKNRTGQPLYWCM